MSTFVCNMLRMAVTVLNLKLLWQKWKKCGSRHRLMQLSSYRKCHKTFSLIFILFLNYYKKEYIFSFYFLRIPNFKLIANLT